MLVRKINKSKWITNQIINDPPLADSLTGCLKTTRNTLSVWRISNETEIEEAVLAIASGLDHLEAIDIIILEDEYFVKHKIPLIETEGRTSVEDLKDTHRDISQLDFWTLGMVAEHIIEIIKNKGSKRFTQKTLKDIIKRALENGRLALTDLTDDVQRKIV